MAEIIKYKNEFLPHVTRLFSPDVDMIDARLNYFRQLFTMYQPTPEQSCLMVKGRDRLLACAYLISLAKIQPGLIYVNLAVDKELTQETWTEFWAQCVDLAKSVVTEPPILRIASSGDIPVFIRNSGFDIVQEQVELHAPLGHLPPIQNISQEEFQIITLEDPQHEKNWLDVFNHGLTVFWDMPPLDAASFQRLRNSPGFDGSAFRLGMGDGEPVSALFYSVMDRNLGTVRINAAATSSGKRSRGFGRRMIKETLNYLESQGMQEAIIYTDKANQATSLLFKMLGFQPRDTIKILERREVGSQSVSKPIVEKEVAAASDTGEGQDSTGFFPVFNSAFASHKPK